MVKKMFIALAVASVMALSAGAQAQVVSAAGKGDVAKATSGAACAKRTIGGTEVAVDLLNTPTTLALSLEQTIDAMTAAHTVIQINTWTNVNGGVVVCNDGGQGLPRVDFVN